MNGCKYIRERIDAAERPDVFSFEVNEHLSQCDDCERFAFERSALRNLLAEGTRVSAPVNFDAMLTARLAEVKGRRSYWWLASPGYLRLGAATAGLVVMFFAAQYSGLFSDNNPSNKPPVIAVQPSPTPGPQPGPVQLSPPIHDISTGQPVAVTSGNRYRTPRIRRDGAPVDGVPVGYFTAESGGVVLVRGSNGDMDVQLPTVSVGAQPLLYVSAGQRPVRTVGTSF